MDEAVTSVFKLYGERMAREAEQWRNPQPGMSRDDFLLAALEEEGLCAVVCARAPPGETRERNMETTTNVANKLRNGTLPNAGNSRP